LLENQTPSNVSQRHGTDRLRYAETTLR